MSDRRKPRLLVRGATLLGTVLPLIPGLAQEPPVSDPTRAPSAAVTAAAAAPTAGDATLRLYSTRASEQGWVALINDRVVAPGDRVAGAEVVSIEAGRVRMRRGDDTFTLSLGGIAVKRSAAGERK